MYETNLKTNQQKDINQDLIINQEELFSEFSELQEYYGETLINIKQQKKEKERLERQIQTLEEVYLQLQDELLQISSDSEMCSKYNVKKRVWDSILSHTLLITLFSLNLRYIKKLPGCVWME